MIKIRKNVFETNSSSTHAMCVCTEPFPYSVFKTRPLIFQFSDFGWEFCDYRSVEDKASYLYSLANTLDCLEEFKKQVTQWGQEDGIEVVFKSLEESQIENSECSFGYVDHGSEAQDFYDYIMSKKETFFSFIYDPNSFIVTANDNSYEYSEDDLDVHVGYPHLEFYKGN